MTRVLLALAAALVALPAAAQEQVEPDRPDVTNGTHIVTTGLVQIEIGALYTHAAAHQHAFGSPTTVRVGLTDWIEARVGTDGVLTQTDGVTSVVGLGNTQLGAKLRLWADEGGIPVLSVLPMVTLPSANPDKGLGSGEPDYTIALLTGSDLGRHAHVDVNYGIGSIGAGGGAPHFTQHLVSASLSDAISDRWNPYVEMFWFSRQEADGSHVVAMDAGAIYELGSRYALDCGLQLGVAGGPGLTAFGGVTVIVGDVVGAGVHARQRQIQKKNAHHR